MSNEIKKQPSILIVDDNAKNLRVLAEIFRDEDYRIAIAKNGEKALQFLNKIQPDLILLDIMMPDMDGYEVCRRIKASSRTSSIPVIFISALRHLGDKVNAFAVGGVDYIVKPFRVEEVLARVRTHLFLRALQNSLEEKNRELRRALEEVKTLRGFLPICASCKRIRDDEGYWKQVEVYIEENSEARFSHGICPSCREKLYPGLKEKQETPE